MITPEQVKPYKDWFLYKRLRRENHYSEIIITDSVDYMKNTKVEILAAGKMIDKDTGKLYPAPVKKGDICHVSAICDNVPFDKLNFPDVWFAKYEDLSGVY